MKQSRDTRSALRAFRRQGGVLRTSAALRAGVHPEALYKLVEDGHLSRLARGLYRVADAQEFTQPDLTLAAVKVPHAVVCLVSALAYHGLTTQIPRVLQLAVPRGKYAALKVRSPPTKVYRFDPATFEQGIEVHRVDGRNLRVYGVARTVVDCFKYRNKLGLDVAIEALRNARARNRVSNRQLLAIARQLRQEKVMTPYLEALS
jgi:predicted transcriptional regulator of viral defense system